MLRGWHDHRGRYRREQSSRHVARRDYAELIETVDELQVLVQRVLVVFLAKSWCALACRVADETRRMIYAIARHHLLG